MLHPSPLAFVVVLGSGLASTADGPSDALEAALVDAGANRVELERAIEGVADDQREGMRWLIAHMPAADRSTLTSTFLIEHCTLAYESWRAAPWHAEVPHDVFQDAILPYASVDERRDLWREDFRERFLPLVADAKTAGEAATRLNRSIFDVVNVRYSTKRKKAQQSPYESMETGLASCSGLSILLIDACRAVGVPARFVGTASWSDDSGNHSWVEVWDDGWHFTGAAEPTGRKLDRGWFKNRAKTAKAGDPKYGVFAVTWNDSPHSFPLVWEPSNTTIRAIDVTERYARTEPVVPAGCARVFVRVRDGTERKAIPLTLRDANGKTLFEGSSRDETADANDHVTAVLALGATVTVLPHGSEPSTFTVERDEQLVDVAYRAVAAPPPTGSAIDALRVHLERQGLEGVAAQEFAQRALSKAEAAEAATLLWGAHADAIRRERAAEIDAGAITLGDQTMRFWSKTFGDKPKDGRSLWISMHGGGNAPPEINEQQFENQKRLYTLDEGIYLAPRAPTDTWNLWHEAHVDAFFARLIEDLVVLEDVDPNRVYLLGYSAGGDGVYQLAPRLSDRLAAAGMFAGHPNETKPIGMRNVPFALHVGADDAAYKRNAIAAQWGERLDELAAADPGGYLHQVQVHAGKGHWMDREERVALPWMASHTRDPRPTRIVWEQDDIVHDRSYWLAVDRPDPKARVIATHSGQAITIELAKNVGPLRVLLDDTMVDLDQDVIVVREELEVHRGPVRRTIALLSRTLAERGDPRAMFCAEVLTQPE
ncbi:MAG: polyhydroxyalkanoate depolymerase [Planctomycetes bacterium]|nr:polyhydroxyalkanoate depolymerase [Planctomycetota bacterium]